MLRQALEIRRTAYGSSHPRVAVVISRLATVERLRGRPEQALPLYRQAHEIRRRVFAPGHPEIGNSLRRLAECLIDLGRLDQAAETLEEAITILGRRRPRTGCGDGPRLASWAGSVQVVGLTIRS